MNVYVLLAGCFIWVAGALSSEDDQEEEQSREAIARSLWNRYRKFQEKKKSQDNNPGPRNPRNPSLHEINKLMIIRKMEHVVITDPPPPPPTKSIQQLLEEKRREQKARNPKGIRSSSIEEQIKDMTDQLKKLQKKCSTNADCGNTTCCLINSKSQYGQCTHKPRHFNQQCSDFCPCSGGHKGNMECKVKKLKIKGVTTYEKHCLRKKVAEPTNRDLQQVLKWAKGGRRGQVRIPTNNSKKNVLSGKS